MIKSQAQNVKNYILSLTFYQITFILRPATKRTTNMTNEQKIKKLTGANAAVIVASTKEFGFFTEVDAQLAKDLLAGVSDGSVKMGVSYVDARLWFHSPESDTIWKFADRKLNVIAK